MTGRGIARALPLLCALMCAERSARALDIVPLDNLQPSAWIIDLGGYGVFEPIYEGSRTYSFGFKPQIDVWQPGDKEWLTFPNDAVGYNVFETSNFRTGPAVLVTLQSRFHGEDIDLRLGRADVDLAGGVFAEYYPLTYIRTRVELLQGVTGNSGFAANLSADYIWYPYDDWTFSLGPRAQLADNRYASDYFSTQNAQKTGTYVPFHAEGGILSSGAEVTGKYELTRELSTKFFLDYSQLVGDVADSPRIVSRGSSEQFIAGIGASYKFGLLP
jgi:MipA family protein